MCYVDRSEDRHGDGTTNRRSAAAPSTERPSTEISTEDEGHTVLRRQVSETWNVAAMERQPPLLPHDEPSTQAAASSLPGEVYCEVDEQQLPAAHTQHNTIAASGRVRNTSAEEVPPLTDDKNFHGRHDDDDDDDLCVSGAPGCFFPSTSGNASSSRPASVSSSASFRINYGESKYSDLQRMTCNNSPSSHLRVWFCRIRRTPFSLCANCGTPLETSACGGKNSLEVVVGTESAPKCNSSELAPVVLQAYPAQAAPVIEERDCTSVQPSAGTPVAPVEATDADTCVAAITVKSRGVLAPAATPAMQDAAHGCNKGGEYDVQDTWSEGGSNFSLNAASHSSCGRLAKQQRLPVLQLGDIHDKRCLLKQLLPLARLTPFRRPAHTQQAEAVIGARGATRVLLEEEYGKQISDAVEEKDGAAEEEPQKKCHDVADPSVLPRDVTISNSKLGETSAKSVRTCVGYTSSSSSSSSLGLCSSSSSALLGTSARFTSHATAASFPSSDRGFCLKAEWRRAGSRRDRCPSSASSATNVSSVETQAPARTGSHICASSTCAGSTCASRTNGRYSGCMYSRYCCAWRLGCVWGWAFQRHPAATWLEYLGELKCGVAVALSQLPATMTCAIVANVPVTSALHGAWITGLITAVFGGSPLSVTTVTSSLAVTLAKVTRTVCDEKTNTCTDEGLEIIFPALILAGACCLLLGALRLSRFSQFVPSATIVGYLNAVAILNVKAQVVTLKFDPVTSTGYEWLWVLLMISTVFIIMCVWENIPRIRINALVPASVLALAVSSFIEFVLVRRVCGMQTKTVAALSSFGKKDEAEETRSHLQADDSSLWPKPFFLTPANVQPFRFYFRLQDLLRMLELTLALVMVNYMSTLITIDMLSDKSSHLHVDCKPDQHLISVGFANVVACFLGSLPGSTAPSPSLLNLKLNSKGREGAVIGALINLAFVAASPYFLDLVPLGGLAGIIMYTAYHAFQWRTVAAVFASFLPERLRMRHPVLQRKICRSDAFVMLLTTSVALCADIGTAILSGVCIASCVFAWKNAARLKVVSRVDAEAGVKFYRVKGPIFFLTKRKLLRHFDVENDPVSVILELSDEAEQLFDYGALETLDALVTRYRRANKRLKVVGMQCGDRKMIVKAGRLFEFAQIELVEKPLDDSGNVKTIAEMMKLPC